MSGILKRPHIWLALVAGCLLLVALVCYPFGGLARAFGQKCGLAAFLGLWLALAALLVHGWVALVRGLWLRLPRERRNLKTVLQVCLLALVLFVIGNGLLVWVQYYGGGASQHFREGNNITRFQNFWDGLDKVYPELAARIPRGETEWRALPEEVRSELGLDTLGQLDAWGSPRMLVAEDRGDGLWLGVYSRGMDRVSSSRGNDPDDINSWSGEWRDFYAKQGNRHALVWTIGYLLAGLIVAFPPSLWLFGCVVGASGNRQ